MRWVQYLVIALMGAMLANAVMKNVTAKIEKQFELVVFTLSLCDHCAIFETEIMKEYKTHALARTAPLVHVNIDDEGTRQYHLKQPITHVPTAIIMKNGKEVARLSGLTERAYFYAFVRDSIFPNIELASN